jgi:phosphonate transport system substrate-binding protein
MKNGKLVGLAVLMVAVLGVSCFAEDVLKFGVAPVESPKVVYQQFTPLAEYLSKELGMKVELVVAKDYPAAADILGQNTVQVAWLTPTVYPICQKQNPNAGIEPVARFQTDGKGVCQGCIIVPADSPIKTVTELKGKKVAFADINAAAGYLIPRSLLMDNGIDADKDLAEYKFLGTHTNVANAVKMKQFDAGGVKQTVAQKFEKEGAVKILAVSKDVPEHPICVNKNLPKETRDKLVAALLKLKLDKNNKDAPSNLVLTSINPKYTGCEEAKEKDYDVVREMIQKLFGDKFYEKSQPTEKK